MCAKTRPSKLLRKRATEIRRYHVPNAYHAIISDQYGHMRRRDVHPSVIAPAYDEATEIFTVADLAISGAGEQVALASAWELTLPKDYQDFCEVYSEYILVARNAFWLMPAEQIQSITEDIRGGAEIDPDTPHRMFRFAEVVGCQVHYALRQNAAGKWADVVCFGMSESEDEVLGAAGDCCISDASFSDWLNRIIATDGYPLRAGREDPEDELVTRAE